MAAVHKLSVGQPIKIVVEVGGQSALVTGIVQRVVCEPLNHSFVNTLVVVGWAVPAPKDAVPPEPPAPVGERFCR
jgi:hypothetical protein